MSSLNLKLGKTCHGWKRKKNLLTHSCQKSITWTLLWECPTCLWTVLLTHGVLHDVFLGCRDVLWCTPSLVYSLTKTSEMVRLQWSESCMHWTICKWDPLVTHSASNWQAVSNGLYFLWFIQNNLMHLNILDWWKIYVCVHMHIFICSMHQ